MTNVANLRRVITKLTIVVCFVQEMAYPTALVLALTIIQHRRCSQLCFRKRKGIKTSLCLIVPSLDAENKRLCTENYACYPSNNFFFSL